MDAGNPCPTCQSCNWWYEAYDHPTHGQCAQAYTDPDFDTPMGIEIAVITFSSGDYGLLLTLPTFGCILHEPKRPLASPDPKL